MADRYRGGGFYRICDHSGFKVRASDTTKLWTGRIVASRFAGEEVNRHPQDFVRGIRDLQRVPDPRPEAPDDFLDPNEITQDSL